MVQVGPDDWGEVKDAQTVYLPAAYLQAGGKRDVWVIPPGEAGAIEFSGRPMALPLQAAAPAVPVRGGVYMADPSGWNPLGQQGQGAYPVLFDGSQYVSMGTPIRMHSRLRPATRRRSGSWVRSSG